MKFRTGVFYEKSVVKRQIWFKSEEKKSGTSYEDLNTFYCRRRHKLAIKVLLRNAQNFHIVSSGMQLNSTRRRLFFPCVSIKTLGEPGTTVRCMHFVMSEYCQA